tara:strand:+ start:574 stop:1266 length:693 start_codon:yes stop_codon:yes gene_type:complete
MLNSVKLISYSKPVNIEGVDNAEDLVAYCARVSNPSNQANKKTASRLLSYLIKERHWSPFEMVSACLEIETTRDIARQILRHRSFSFQEFSQRYAEVDNKSFETRETRMQDTKNRQNSIEIENDPALQLNLHQQELVREWGRRQHGIINQAREVYQWAIDNGIAKEQARAVLPEGNTVSRLYMNGTIRSWIHYIELRSGNGTQKEHRQVARNCADALSKVFPVVNDFLSK